MTRKRLTLAMLVGILILWIVLQTLHAFDQEDLFLRQMVEVSDVTLTAEGGDPEANKALEAEVEALVEPQLRHLSACLKTPEGSRAPLEIELTFGSEEVPTPRPEQAQDTGATAEESVRMVFRASGGIDADVEQCLHEALDELEWSSVQTPAPFVITLAPLDETAGE